MKSQRKIPLLVSGCHQHRIKRTALENSTFLARLMLCGCHASSFELCRGDAQCLEQAQIHLPTGGLLQEVFKGGTISPYYNSRHTKYSSWQHGASGLASATRTRIPTSTRFHGLVPPCPKLGLEHVFGSRGAVQHHVLSSNSRSIRSIEAHSGYEFQFVRAACLRDVLSDVSDGSQSPGSVEASDTLTMVKA